MIIETFAVECSVVSWVVHKISGGHRKGTHSILGLTVSAAPSAVPASDDGNRMPVP
jgi:hypothetical protein